MSTSIRHHYIPQFFIKNFVGADGMVYVFNKESNRFIENKRPPKSVFFEDNRNTVHFTGMPTDHMEKLYSALDDNLAVNLNTVLSHKTVSPEELTSIVVLANLLKWRIPAQDSEFNQVKENSGIEELKINISVKNTKENISTNALVQIENSEFFKQAKRVLLSVLPFVGTEHLLEIHNNSFINSNPTFPALLGDAPVIEAENNDINTMEDFIFPLSSDDTFIYKKGTRKLISHPIFYLQRDLATFHRSVKYVCCKDKSRLLDVVNVYSKIKEGADTKYIEKHIFNYIV